MSDPPRFDELIGAEPSGPERERLRRAHDLLVLAGPPPELAPQLADGTALELARAPRRRKPKRRRMLLLAAALAAGIFAAGYGIGHTGGGSASEVGATQLKLTGTAAAPHASATLDVWRATGGNWPMTLYVRGLPKLTAPSYYVVYLVRNGHPLAACGTFVVTNSSRKLEVTLNAPYGVRHGDTWIVTREGHGAGSPGLTVLRPAA